MPVRREHAVRVTLSVTVWVDPTDPILVDRVRSERGASLTSVVRDDLQTKGNALSYVMNVHVTERPREDRTMTVRFTPNDKGNPPGKLADAELHFSGGPLDGLKLIGFAVWERKAGGRNVTFPSRQYSVNGERRSFALLRPVMDAQCQDRLRDLVLAAFADHEKEVAEV